jgi:HD-GYP domain-containing protein (c-di-GMP phosphodiesterase class II)
MRQLSIDQLQSGMLLGQGIVDELGRSLLARGSKLTTGFIRALRERDCHSAWVMDGIADDIQPPDILTPQVRASTRRHLQGLFSLAQTASKQEKNPEAAAQALSGTAKKQTAQVLRDVYTIVDEMSFARVIPGTVNTRTLDGYDFDRAAEVAATAVLFGHQLGLDTYDLEGLALGCLLLDLGNLAVPADILKKPSRLSAEELAAVRRHAEAGFTMVREMIGDSSITARHVVRQHHERQDGAGYPQGLHGTNSLDSLDKRRYAHGLIMPTAEIAAIADVYTALASDRPHRARLAPHEVVTTMSQMAGTHLNERLLAQFLSILPAYPVLSRVIVTAGTLKDYRGVVTRVDPRSVSRPTVRILFGPSGHEVRPFEVDTAKEKGIEIVHTSFSDMGEDPA